MSSSPRIVLADGALAEYPEGGGVWSWFLQYLHSLRALGHDFLWLELYIRSENPDEDERKLSLFFDRAKKYGFADSCAVLVADREGPLTLDTVEIRGKSTSAVRDYISTADVLWNVACCFRQPLLSLFKRRVLIEGDPGHVHVSALTWDMGIGDHDVHLTAGLRVGTPGCEVPTLGVAWHHFFPFVHLPLWSVSVPPENAPISSITQWNWGELWYENRVLSISKREAYLRYLDLPRSTSLPFLLAANIHPQDKTGDRELLREHGWELTHPHDVAATPEQYQNFIRSSYAEFCVPKPVFRLLRTGWFGDRNAAYLASGRPVMIEDTGFRGLLPIGEGILVFSDPEEAANAIKDLEARYEFHARAAREIAEEYLDGKKVLAQMLRDCGF